MKRKLFASAVFLGGIAVPAHSADHLNIGLAADGSCRAELMGEILPTDPAALLEKVLAAFPDRKKTIRIVGTADTPYRCIGGLIFNLQRVGHRRFKWVTAPLPEKLIKQDQ